MADSWSITVETSAVLRALDTLGTRAGAAVLRAARETAEAVRDEARARLARQTAGSGQTAEAITLDAIPGGYRVFVGPVSGRAENLPLWLEQGTTGVRAMQARPFLFAAARLEEGNHLRRVSEALEDVVQGLGD